MRPITLRDRIKKFLDGKIGFVNLQDIYKAMDAKNCVQKTSVRIMLGKGLGRQFIRHPKYPGFYKASRKDE